MVPNGVLPVTNSKDLLTNNRAWSGSIKQKVPDFFPSLAKQQTPNYLWIGCSDSRVPPNTLVDVMPGELFVHRNIANLVMHTDLNLLSVLEYAVEILKVKEIIICGHYGCGGVRAAMGQNRRGLIDHWLRSIKDTYLQHRAQFEALTQNNHDGDTEDAQVNLLCELNVIQQVQNLCHTSIVQNAWQNNQSLKVHGWIYNLEDGLLKDLETTIDSQERLDRLYQ